MRKALVLGWGKSGKAAAALALSKGFSVAAADDNPRAFQSPGPEFSAVDFFSSGGVPAGFKADTVIASPGIPSRSKLMDMARALCPEEPVAELEFAFGFCKTPILAVTGTNGKTTTTELTAHILTALGFKVRAAGNIGDPLSGVLLEDEKAGVRPDFYVAEVSSFQLDGCRAFAPLAAALLNISSDHQDRYPSFEDYERSKFSVFNNIGDTGRMILAAPLLDRFKKHTGLAGAPFLFSSGPAAGAEADLLFDGEAVRAKGRPHPLLRMNDARLRGAHNAENIMAALGLVAAAAGTDAALSKEAVRAALWFAPDSHRMEIFEDRDGVRFMDDSKATNPHSVEAALKTFCPGKDALIILGGLDKDMDFKLLRPLAGSIKEAFLIGESKGKILEAIGDIVPCRVFADFKDAVFAACSAAAPGNIVMLSPGCASMDMFKNYRERGDKFKAAAREWLLRVKS